MATENWFQRAKRWVSIKRDHIVTAFSSIKEKKPSADNILKLKEKVQAYRMEEARILHQKEVAILNARIDELVEMNALICRNAKEARNKLIREHRVDMMLQLALQREEYEGKAEMQSNLGHAFYSEYYSMERNFS